MKHLIICTEFPPAPIPPGGIGTYVVNISRLLAEAGETVHVLGLQWSGAPKRREELCNGRLIIHRVPKDEIIPGTGAKDRDPSLVFKEIEGLLKSENSEQCFAWQVGLYAEKLVEEEGIDLIESQEINAPLYYFQLRRALGLGPKRKPPCFIHLHSSSEQIVRYNEWDAGNPFWVTAKRLEDYSIAAADALLCPSRFLARQTEREFGLPLDSVNSIPLPIGDTPLLKRTDQVWNNGKICYVGRLEPRKGVIEWVDAAVSVLDEYPSVEFEFIGADLQYKNGITVKQFIEMRIPARMKSNFYFQGSRSRDELMNFLGKARMAVVPSRWENFPNTCIEAMCSGLPVIASPNGGMAEMITDNETGWLAKNARSDGLAENLRHALETPSSRVTEMGTKASSDIRHLCDNNKTVERHLEFRAQLANKGAVRSLQLPVNLPWSGRPLSDESARRHSANGTGKGLAFIIDCLNTEQFPTECIQSLENQTMDPTAVILLIQPFQKDTLKQEIERISLHGWQICEADMSSPVASKNHAVETVLAGSANPVAFVFIDANDRLYPGFTEICESVFLHGADIGLVSSWVLNTEGSESFQAHPCPAFPYQMLSNETISATAVRTEALMEAGMFRVQMNSGFEQWDLMNAVMASDWKAVTVPEILSEHTTQKNSIIVEEERMQQELLARFPEVVARDAQELVNLLRQRNPGFRYTADDNAAHYEIVRLRDIFTFSPAQLKRMIGKHIRDPRTAIKFLGYKLVYTPLSRIPWLGLDTAEEVKPDDILRPRDVFKLSKAQRRGLFRNFLLDPGEWIKFLLWHLKSAFKRETNNKK